MFSTLSTVNSLLPVAAFAIPAGIIGLAVYLERRKAAVVAKHNAEVEAELATLTPAPAVATEAPTA